MTVQIDGAPLSAAQLGDLALDAAMEIDRFIAHDAVTLDSTRQLLQSVAQSLKAGNLSQNHNGRFELSYLPIYARAVAAHGDVPATVEDFSTKVQKVLDGFLAAERQKDEALLPDLRDFCLSVHEQALSERLDVISSTQPTLRRGSFSY